MILQGQAVDKAAQSRAALRAPPAPLKTTGATERPPLIPHVGPLQMECAERKCRI